MPLKPESASPPRRGFLCGLAALALLAPDAVAAQALRRRSPRWRGAPGGGRGFGRGPAPRGWRGRALQRYSPAERERIRSAIQAGEVRPLRELNARIRSRGGELLDADLFETELGWVYALRVLGPRGRVRDVLFDARTLRPLDVAPPPD